MNIVKKISQNPFRLFGVYSTATAREIAASTAKINAYSKIGKDIVFDSDNIFNDVLEKPIRSEDAINNALAQINLPEDKIRHALFWFSKVKPIDEMAINYVIAHDCEKAVELCEKLPSAFGILNKALINLIMGQYNEAVRCYIDFTANDSLCDEYIKKIVDDTCDITSSKLLQIIVDVLVSAKDGNVVSSLLSYNETKDIAKELLIGAPKKTIVDAIAVAKSVGSKDASKNLQAGRDLMNTTKSALKELKSILGSSDPVFQRISDNLANQILQCSINYYNETEELAAPLNAKELAEYAMSIAIGAMAKARIKENYDIIHKNALNCPPAAVIEDVLRIRSLYNQTGTIEEKLKKIIPSLVAIYDRLGKGHAYLPIIASEVGKKFLNEIIDSVNALNSWSSNRESVINGAWRVTAYLDHLKAMFGFTTDFFIRYDTNRSTLSSIRSRLGYSFSPNIDKSLFRTDEEIYGSCRSTSDFEEYLKLKPNGSHVGEVNERFRLTKDHTEKAKSLLEKEKSIDMCIKVHQMYPFADEITSEVFWQLCKRSSAKRKLYLETFGENGLHAPNIRARERHIKKGYISLLIVTAFLICLAFDNLVLSIFVGLGAFFGMLLMWIMEADKDDVTPPSELKRQKDLEKTKEKQRVASKYAAFNWRPRILCASCLAAINIVIGLVAFLSSNDTVGLIIVFVIGVCASLVNISFLLAGEEKEVDKSKRYSYWIDGILAALLIVHLIWGSEGLGVVGCICAFIGFYFLLGLIQNATR